MTTAQHALFDLVSPGGASAALARGADWDAVAARASDHRLEPLLHAFHGSDERLPEALRARWAAAARAATFEALAWQRDLGVLLDELDRHGIGAVVLKGPALALGAYPHIYMRPLRDLDLLVSADRIEEAFEQLLAAGYARLDGDRADPAAAARSRHQLPPLVAPGGTLVELHVRAFHGTGPDPADDSEVRGRFRPVPLLDRQMTIMGPEDMLLHLIEHAAAHRLDNGPLVLADLAFWIGANPDLDWGLVEVLAQRQGLVPLLVLLLGAAARAFPEIRLSRAIADRARAPDVLAVSRDLPLLMLVDPEAADGRHRRQAIRSPWAALGRLAWPSRDFLAAHYGPADGPGALTGQRLRNVGRVLGGRIPAMVGAGSGRQDGAAERRLDAFVRHYGKDA